MLLNGIKYHHSNILPKAIVESCQESIFGFISGKYDPNLMK